MNNHQDFSFQSYFTSYQWGGISPPIRIGLKLYHKKCWFQEKSAYFKWKVLVMYLECVQETCIINSSSHSQKNPFKIQFSNYWWCYHISVTPKLLISTCIGNKILIPLPLMLFSTSSVFSDSHIIVIPHDI